MLFEQLAEAELITPQRHQRPAASGKEVLQPEGLS